MIRKMSIHLGVLPDGSVPQSIGKSKPMKSQNDWGNHHPAIPALTKRVPFGSQGFDKTGPKFGRGGIHDPQLWDSPQCQTPAMNWVCLYHPFTVIWGMVYTRL